MIDSEDEAYGWPLPKEIEINMTKKDRKEYNEMMNFEHYKIYKCFIKEVDEITRCKITPKMDYYDLNGTTTEMDVTFGYIDMKDDSVYWTNVLDWKIVKEKESLTKYIKHKLGHYDTFDERLKIYKGIHTPELYKRILNRKVVHVKNHMTLLDSKSDNDLKEWNV